MKETLKLLLPVACCSLLSVTSAVCLTTQREFFALGFVITGMVYTLYWCIITPPQPGELRMGEDDGQGPRLN